MQIHKIFFLTLMLGLSVSCLKQSENIDPIAPVKTLAEIQREIMMTAALEAAGNNAPSKDASINVEKGPADAGIFYLNMKYNIKDLDVFDSTNLANGFESLSNYFVRALANIFIKMSGGRTVNIGEVDIPIPDLGLDFSVIKSIKLKALRLQYGQSMDQASDFSFLKTLNINKSTGESILTYRKTSSQCDYKCIEFIVQDGNILDLIKDTNVLKIDPVMSITRLPDITGVKLDGDVDLQIGLKLPF